MVFVFCSCHKKEDFVCVSLNDFDSLRTAGYDVSADNVFSNIRALMGSDTTNSIADIHARRHYRKDMDMLWITRDGVSSNADTLLTFIQRVDSFGFSREKFYYSMLKEEIGRASCRERV